MLVVVVVLVVLEAPCCKLTTNAVPISTMTTTDAATMSLEFKLPSGCRWGAALLILETRTALRLGKGQAGASRGKATKYLDPHTANPSMAFKVVTKSFEVKTKNEDEILDITADVQGAVAAAGLFSGVATVFLVGSTAAITTMEFEPGLVKDFPTMLRRTAPAKGVEYEHQRRWHDGNGHSHVKASLVGPSLCVPFVTGELILGEWQQVVLVEFDVRPRTRKVVVQLMGD